MQTKRHRFAHALLVAASTIIYIVLFGLTVAWINHKNIWLEDCVEKTTSLVTIYISCYMIVMNGLCSCSEITRILREDGVRAPRMLVLGVLNGSMLIATTVAFHRASIKCPFQSVLTYSFISCGAALATVTGELFFT